MKNAIWQCLVVEWHPQYCNSEGWHSNRWLTCNTVPKSWCSGDFFQPWGDITVVYFGTIILWTASAHMQTVLFFSLHTHTSYVWWHLASSRMLRPPHHVKCKGFTVHNSATLHHSRLCSQMQQSTPDHTQPCCWVWSVVQQTWTFQPVEVSARILTPYMI